MHKKKKLKSDFGISNVNTWLDFSFELVANLLKNVNKKLNVEKTKVKMLSTFFVRSLTSTFIV